MLLKNGYVVVKQGGRRCDIRIDGEIIHELDDRLVPRMGEPVIDAAGMIILPGGVDAHTHMDLTYWEGCTTDDFYSGTVAAACGGTTTIINHTLCPRGTSLHHQVNAGHRLAMDKAVIDYSFHGLLDHADDAILDELAEMAAAGITSHKINLAYNGEPPDDEILALMERTAQLGVLLTIHSESNAAIAHLQKKFRAMGRTTPVYHARSRPPESEAEAICRMAFYAKMLGDVPLYISPLSCELSLRFVRAARWWRLRNLFVETCPHYLYLNEERYLEPDGRKYIVHPPLRPSSDSAELWRGIVEGDIDTISTDHCSCFYAQDRLPGKQEYTVEPGGIPGVEARMALLFSEVSAGRLSFQRMVELCCTTPARLFGLYPKKGVISEGSDADLVVFDPNRTVRITHDILHENSDYTPYEGMILRGWPVMTISRGEVIVEDGRFTGRRGRGKFIRRRLPDLTVRDQAVVSPY